MLGKKKQQLGNLKIQWAELEWEIAETQGSDVDPDMKYHHINDLQYAQYLLEQEIDDLEHELAMIPLKLMLGGFVIFVIGMTIYMMS
jgi:hypothetical protein